jgi:PPM family protein phosphatase
MSFEIQYAGRTDPGLVRKNNEDQFVLRPDLGFCAVADGMGGAASGEVASRIFVDTAVEVFAGSSPAEPRPDVVKRAFTTANARMLEHVAANPADAGMGCTAEILAFSDGSIVIGHVGDSRTYRLRGGELRQLTLDHSLIQAQISQGLITPEEARKHSMRHVILRAVGTRATVELDILSARGQAGDVFLLCSDGLHDMVEDAGILRLMTAAGGLEAMAGMLVEGAKGAGGKDNVTVVLARLAEGAR